MPTNPIADYEKKSAVLKKAITNSVHAICNVKTGDAICVSGFSMKPESLYGGKPQDFDLPQWHDEGREIDSMLWLVSGDFPNAFEIRNNKSGLWLGGLNASTGTLMQVEIATLWRGNIGSDGSIQIYDILPNKLSGQKIAETDTKGSWPRGKFRIKYRQAPELEDIFSWQFRKVDYAAKAFEPFNIEKEDHALEYATAALTMATDLAYYVGQSANDIGKITDADKPAAIVSLVANVIGGVTTFAANVISFVEIGEDDNDDSEDPIITLYNKLIPEIRRIVEDTIDTAFLENNIGTALGIAKTGRDHLEAAAKLLVKNLKTNPSDEDLEDILRNPRQLTANLMSNAYGEYIAQLEKSDEAYLEAMNFISERPDHSAYFPIWVQIASQRLITLTLLHYVGRNDPDLAFTVLKKLRGEAQNRYKQLLDTRLGKIESALKADNHYRIGREFSLDPVAYEAHVINMTDLAFNKPSEFLKSIDDILAKIPN
jgi:hypothetical protein